MNILLGMQHDYSQHSLAFRVPVLRLEPHMVRFPADEAARHAVVALLVSNTLKRFLAALLQLLTSLCETWRSGPMHVLLL